MTKTQIHLQKPIKHRETTIAAATIVAPFKGRRRADGSVVGSSTFTVPAPCSCWQFMVNIRRISLTQLSSALKYAQGGGVWYSMQWIVPGMCDGIAFDSNESRLLYLCLAANLYAAKIASFRSVSFAAVSRTAPMLPGRCSLRSEPPTGGFRSTATAISHLSFTDSNTGSSQF